MDTEKCKVLLQIIESGSFSAAAEQTGYTPSGLSRLVISMEEEAGFPLLYRGRHGVNMTRECEMLLPVLKEMVRLENTYRQICDSVHGLDTGQVVVGTAYSIYYKWLAKVIAAFTNEFPGIEVRIRGGKSTEFYRMIDEHEMDFCIVSKRSGEADWHHLFYDPLVAVISANSSYALQATFPLCAFETEPYIETFQGQDTDNSRMFERNRILPNVQFATDDTYASHRMVESGLGISLNNYIEAKEREYDKHVKLLKLNPPQPVEIGIATPKEASLSPAAGKFKAFAMRFIDELIP